MSPVDIQIETFESKFLVGMLSKPRVIPSNVEGRCERKANHR
jgi:hypothetical protein